MPILSHATDDQDLIRARATVGDAEIIICTDGTCRFDGGAMFGVVPKTLWSKKVAADELNRITLELNCVVVRRGGKTVLIESGFGNKIAPKLKTIYATQERLPASLHAAGIQPDEVDIVINTHLHWYHCSWNTTARRNRSSGMLSTLPTAARWSMAAGSGIGTASAMSEPTISP